mgnify:CR=1 FL=1
MCARASRVQREIDWVHAHSHLAGSLVDRLAAGEIPLRVTHNDTKLNNVMLDNATGKGIAVIDLDTVMPGSLCYDFGDSIRFGCNTAAEDEPDCSKTVSISFANGVKAQLVMTAFTERGGRKYTFHGTLGELQLDETRDLLLVAPFGGEQERLRISDLVAAARAQGHGGGDTGTVAAFYDLLCGNAREETMLGRSAESHFIAYAAERSRRTGVAVDMANER